MKTETTYLKHYPEREALKAACLAELSGNPAVKAASDFVAFCEALSRPENLVLVPSTQYVERVVPLRQEVDMVHEIEYLAGWYRLMTTAIPSHTP